MSRSLHLTSIFRLILAAFLLQISQQAQAQPANGGIQQTPVTTDFVLLIDAREKMAGTTTESNHPFGRLTVAVAAAQTAVQAIPEDAITADRQRRWDADRN